MRYLLGKLSEQETSEFEAQCFEDDTLFHEMNELENDLLHSYVRGELSTDERKAFEAGYLTSPARQRRVEFVHALEHHLFGSREAPAPAEEHLPLTKPPVPPGLIARSWQVSAISGAVAVVALAIISWLAMVNYRLKGELHQMQLQQAELRHAQQDLESKLATLTARLQESGSDVHSQPQPSSPAVIALNLAPGLPRSADTIQQLTLPPKALRVELNLHLENDKYATYRASLQTTEGKQVWRKTAIKSRADSQGRRIVSCGIPSDLLRKGDYVLRLDGVPETDEVEEDIAAYRFAVSGH